MFAPDHRRCAAELLRVVRDGGRIGLANWTPDSFVGQLFKVIGKAIPPPQGLSSPLLWGTEAYLGELFGDAAATISTARRDFVFRYASPAHMLQVFRDYYGPVHKAFGALDAAGRLRSSRTSWGCWSAAIRPGVLRWCCRASTWRR
jgi:hypothetical protein